MSMNTFNAQVVHKNKVVFVMGATGAGKSRLSIDLATLFPAEIINSDKMQVYKGLDIVTNKIDEAEQQRVPHHLLGEVDPESNFTARDFSTRAMSAMKRIMGSGGIPIIVGGSNSFIEALVEDPLLMFRSKFDCCFLWLHVSSPVLYSFVSKRVDDMVDAGLVDEVEAIFDPEADYSRGIRRAIGVPEMDKYLRAKMNMEETNTSKEMLLGAAIEEIKVNTCKLIQSQLGKIYRLRDDLGWPMHRIDATCVFQKSGDEADAAWEEMVLQPTLKIVSDFLKQDPDPNMFVAQTITSTSMEHQSVQAIN